MEKVYVFRWGRYRPDLKGLRCRLLARGTMNSALVMFETGEKAVISRNALRKSGLNGPAAGRPLE